VADAAFHLPFSIWISRAARHHNCAVVRQHIAVQRIQRGIVDVRLENAFLQVVRHDDLDRAAEPAECFLV
jgi:hypothetical protein